MKKKKLLGILAVLMVFALALTGCGQQSGEQNAGATGSESQNEAIDNGNSSADEIVETEPENGGESPNDNTSSNKSPTQVICTLFTGHPVRRVFSYEIFV